MDRFKYKIWNTISKEWVTNYKNFKLSHDGKIEALGGVTMVPERGMIPVMCTGLKDKNKKLIFEGDVVRYLNGEEYSIAQVKYVNSEFALWTKRGFHRMSLLAIEIIGNIFEHSHLLENS